MTTKNSSSKKIDLDISEKKSAFQTYSLFGGQDSDSLYLQRLLDLEKNQSNQHQHKNKK